MKRKKQKSDYNRFYCMSEKLHTSLSESLQDLQIKPVEPEPSRDKRIVLRKAVRAA